MCKRYGRHSVISPVNTSDVWYKYTEYLFWVYFSPTVKFTLSSIFCSPSSTLNTPLQFNSSPLKNDGWKTILSFFGPGNFSRAKTVDLLGSIHCGSTQKIYLHQTESSRVFGCSRTRHVVNSSLSPWPTLHTTFQRRERVFRNRTPKASGRCHGKPWVTRPFGKLEMKFSVDRWINAKELLRKDLFRP